MLRTARSLIAILLLSIAVLWLSATYSASAQTPQKPASPESEQPKPVDVVKLTAGAEAGDVDSITQLARMYWSGQGVREDVKTAVDWYEKAAELGSLEAQMILGAANFGGVKIPQNYALAGKYLLLAANQKNNLAEFYVGYMYQHGTGLEKSPEKAVHYMESSIADGSSVAQYELGVWYSTGSGVIVDRVRACNLFELGAKQGDPRAANSLGRCYAAGDGREKDPLKAMAAFTQAAAAGNTDAEGSAAILCGETGDWEQSYMWLRIAVDAGVTQDGPALGRIKLKLTPAQIQSAETRASDWERQHPMKK